MIADRYQPIEQIGTGGMATVWKARDTLLGRLVAIKRLLPHLAGDPEAAQRFKREAQASASLSHPGIVTVFDSGEDGDGPYIILELVEGTTLAAHLAQTGPLDPGTVTEIVAQVALALDHAHAQGVIHRDIKPSNLILEGGGRVRLADFGIARTIDDPATITDSGELVGTITYLAPEILAGQPATTSSDIYALGAVTYELLSGRPPYRAENPAALLEAVHKGVVPSLAGVAPDQMAVAVATAMSKDPLSRPPSAGELSAALTGSATLVMSGAAAAPVAAASEEPTVVTRPATAARVAAESEPSRGIRWSLLALILLVLALAAAAITNDRDTDPTDLAAPTTFPAPTTVFAPMTTVTTSPTTIPTTTTTTLATTTSTAPPTPESLAEEIGGLLAVLGPPQFRNRDVRQIEDQIARVMEEWENDDREDLIRELQQTFEDVADLDESPERETLTAQLNLLAELMGFEVDQDGPGNDDG